MSDQMRTIESVKAVGPHTLALRWSGGEEARLDLACLLRERAFRSLSKTFDHVEIGDWGHSLVWPDGVELGADRLWLETLSALNKPRTRAFLEWRIRNGLSLSKAASALGMTRRTIAYYSSGEREIPLHVLLACLGWDHWDDRVIESVEDREEELVAELTH